MHTSFIVVMVLYLIFIGFCLYKLGETNAKRNLLRGMSKMSEKFDEDFEKVKAIPENNDQKLIELARLSGRLQTKGEMLEFL